MIGRGAPNFSVASIAAQASFGKRIRRRLERNRKFVDSPLEGDGFEPSVPRRKRKVCSEPPPRAGDLSRGSGFYDSSLGGWIRTISSARADTDLRMWISASKRGELVDLVGDWALTFAAAACDLVHCRSRSGRHDETRAELRPGLYRAMADHRDGRIGRNRPGRIGAHYLQWQGPG